MSIKNNNLSVSKALADFIDSLQFGDFVRHMRSSDEVSQTELANRLGFTRQFLNAIELNKKIVSIELAKEISKALGYSPEPFVKVLLNDMLRRSGINKTVEFKQRKIA
jgi:transcriptional regulator with XRE-family HTH domain